MMILFKCIHCNKKLLQMCKMILQYIDNLWLPLQFSRENILWAFYHESFVLKAILNSYLKYLQVDQRLCYTEVEPFRHTLCLVTKILLGCFLLLSNLRLALWEWEKIIPATKFVQEKSEAAEQKQISKCTWLSKNYLGNCFRITKC